jgi:hypothetical protein
MGGVNKDKTKGASDYDGYEQGDCESGVKQCAISSSFKHLVPSESSSSRCFGWMGRQPERGFVLPRGKYPLLLYTYGV